MTFYEVSIDFGPYGPRSWPFTGHFVTFPNIQLLAQTEATMTHFVTLTVPPSRTDHSLRHSTTHTVFGTQANFFGNLPDCHKILVDDILRCFH
jgi:hypothetical protein